ncbi:MAG: rod-binding protein [Planctomycetes bacterium]|nr:rod-binding protein [Planctomycetota bacterium]
MNALDALGMSPKPGGMTAFQQSKENRAAERAEALKLGQGVTEEDELEKKVRGVAQVFVSVFMNQVMKSMRATVNENEAMHGDNGEKFFQDMLDTEQSKTLAQGSGYGLTDLIYESMMASYRVRSSEAGSAAGDSTNGSAEQTVEPTPAISGVAGIGE